MSFAASILRLGGGVVALLSAVPAGVPASGAPGPSARTVPVLIDTEFQRGLQARDRANQAAVIRWREEGAPAVWRVAQHHSQSNVTDAAFQKFRDRGFTFRDGFQWLTIHPEDGSADFILGVNAGKEFGGTLRVKGDPWPHLYLTQRIGPPGGHREQREPSIQELDRIDFRIQVRLLYDRRPAGVPPDPRIHAAQFLFFLTIQNLNRASPGHGDYYWFGILLYDDRHPVTSLRAQRDVGSAKKPATGKLIYNVGVKPFTERVVASGEWVEVSGDLLPHIVAGLNEAWRQGYLGGSKAQSDYGLGSAVLGWEITGLNDAAMAVKGLSCVAQARR
jgi:hypothetical protein